ncbi:MAG: hypothetical protein AB9891_05630 [Anaerolineaceae bacterium]
MNVCPICGVEIPFDMRYPNAVCRCCVEKASDRKGRQLSFFNEGMSGGLKSIYAGTGEPYDSEVCYIKGVMCRAREAHMGGVVVEKI